MWCCKTVVLLFFALLLAAHAPPLQLSSRNTALYFTAFKVSKMIAVFLQIN